MEQGLLACEVVRQRAKKNESQAVLPVLFWASPDPLVRGTDPDPDPSIIKQK
jgi:hypothetical protein